MARSEQLEQEADRTRGRIKETLVKLREQLSPAQERKAVSPDRREGSKA